MSDMHYRTHHPVRDAYDEAMRTVAWLIMSLGYILLRCGRKLHR